MPETKSVMASQRASTNRPDSASPHAGHGFTLIELLVVIAIIALLISILLPTLSAARAQGRAARCLSQLRTLGQGMTMYTTQNGDVLVPGRLPVVDDCNWQAPLYGRQKYRPTFLAMMSLDVGVPPFDDPMACRSSIDRFGERGDRQNYASPTYVCPDVAEWTDERNGSYGYNYQFLGNSRLSDPSDIHSFKNWPVQITKIRYASRAVAVGDSMGTAASLPAIQRQEYENNARDWQRLGNEGFNLDPPWVDPVDGEMAGFDDSPQHRSAADPRHRERANILFVDGHGAAMTLEDLGYELAPDGSIAFDGDNRLWTGNASDVPWTPTFRP